MELMEWHPAEAGSTIGDIGTENGIILRDEVYSGGARITLERDGYTPFAITCGISGWMVHTRLFATEQEANEAFETMKSELACILDLIPSHDDPQANERMTEAGEAMRAFIKEFP